MECDEARDRLLRTDLSELTGEEGAFRERADSELARHLSACGDCRRLLRLFVSAETSLSDALGEAGPTTGSREAADRALATDGTSIARWRRVWIPLAAAALLLLALWLPQLRDSPVERPASPGRPGSDLATDFRVEAPPGRSITVIQAGDPTVRVVWFHSSTTGSTP